MKKPDLAIALLCSFLLGLLVVEWRAIARVAGIGTNITASDSAVAPEYWVGFIAVALLGAVFPRRAVLCAIVFMMGPVSLRHIAYIVENGIPNLWPIEIAFILLLTLPYMAVAYLAAKARMRFLSPST